MNIIQRKLKNMTKLIGTKFYKIKKKEINNDAINTIYAYKEGNYWAFDDADKGLNREGLVGSTHELLDKISNSEDKTDGVKCAFRFARYKFPGSNLTLELVNHEGGASDYFCIELNHEVWLCPNLLKYWDYAPDKIYVEMDLSNLIK